LRYEGERAKRISRTKAWKAANPVRSAQIRQRERERQPEIFKARKVLKDAVRRGRITKPLQCGQCGAAVPKAELQGHHHDYSKPLDVEWLCRACHAAEHRALKSR
jgi:formylmethanofuran dehydrogenase subunit E